MTLTWVDWGGSKRYGTSLVDCLQETFGLTPVEAMAAGLPVVVSDWNGYRDTVVDNRTGYRVATHSFQPGWSGLELQQLAVSEHGLDHVSAHISGQISVDTISAGAALARLASSPELAVGMGTLGMQRVQKKYDWKVILTQYSELLDELAHRRDMAMRSDDQLTEIDEANSTIIPSLQSMANTSN